MMRSLPALVAALTVALAGCKKKSPPEPAATETVDPRVAPYADRARSIIDELAAHGVSIDGAKLTYELRDPVAAADDHRRYRQAIYGSGYWEWSWCLARELGLGAGDSPEDLARVSLTRAGDALAGYYAADRKAIVFLDTPQARAMDQDYLMAHELAHAYHGQQAGGVTAYLDRPSYDQTAAAHSLLEGSADLLALSLLRGRRGASLMSLSAEDLLADRDRYEMGEHAAAIYGYGAQFMLRRYHVGDWKLSDPHPGSPPPSTEQLMHPEKLERDQPTRVLLPDWPAEAGPATLIASNEVGELGVLLLLLDLGLPRREAELVAAGWDGDQLAAYRTGAGDCAIMWRTTWDRLEDAKQFFDVMRLRVLTASWAGWVVDISTILPRPHGSALLRTLRAAPPPPRSAPADGASTALIEQTIAARRGGSIDEGRWSHEDLGVSFPVPSDFVSMPPGSLPGAARVVDGKVDLAVVVRFPDPLDAGLMSVLEAEQKRLLLTGGRVIEAPAVVEDDGARQARAEYEITDDDGTQRVLIRASDKGGRLRGLFVFVDAERWPKLETELRALVDGARFE